MSNQKPPPISFNYIYFGIFLAILMLISLSSLLAKESTDGSRSFFLFYSFGQALWEVGLFVFIGWAIQHYFGNRWFSAFIGFTFVCFLCHILDFFLNRVLDLSLFATLSFVFGESLDNFFYLLDASGVPSWMWAILFSCIAAIPWIGIALYKSSHLITQRKPIAIRAESFIQFLFCVPAALFLWDLSTSRTLHPDAYTEFLKALPLKHTFLSPTNIFLQLNTTLSPAPSEMATAEAIDHYAQEAPLTKRPNIYLFVIESFRADFITPEVAPALSQFRDQNLSFPLSVSNGNASHISWFSIFHSKFPYYWNQTQKEEWSMGSPGIQALKQLGYKIHLYSSAQLNYYGMEQLLFGSLLDETNHFHHHAPKQAWQSDHEALTKLVQDRNAHPELTEGQLYIIFWDATHFDYSWPRNKPSKFTPFAKDIAYFRMFHTEKNIEQIKNRYRNAVHYIDTLFGNFLEQVPDHKQSVMIVLGDHAEEFFEHGHLFHCSHLVPEQFHIPLYFKFPTHDRKVVERPVISQMDIFPSLLDYLTGQPATFLQGQSIFRKSTWPYAIIARFNGGRTPYEFCVHTGKNQLIARFVEEQDIFNSETLQLISLKSCRGRTLTQCREHTAEWISEEFGPAINRLTQLPD